MIMPSHHQIYNVNKKLTQLGADHNSNNGGPTVFAPQGFKQLQKELREADEAIEELKRLKKEKEELSNQNEVSEEVVNEVNKNVANNNDVNYNEDNQMYENRIKKLSNIDTPNLPKISKEKIISSSNDIKDSIESNLDNLPKDITNENNTMGMKTQSKNLDSEYEYIGINNSNEILKQNKNPNNSSYDSVLPPNQNNKGNNLFSPPTVNKVINSINTHSENVTPPNLNIHNYSQPTFESVLPPIINKNNAPKLPQEFLNPNSNNKQNVFQQPPLESITPPNSKTNDMSLPPLESTAASNNKNSLPLPPIESLLPQANPTKQNIFATIPNNLSHLNNIANNQNELIINHLSKSNIQENNKFNNPHNEFENKTNHLELNSSLNITQPYENKIKIKNIIDKSNNNDSINNINRHIIMHNNTLNDSSKNSTKITNSIIPNNLNTMIEKLKNNKLKLQNVNDLQDKFNSINTNKNLTKTESIKKDLIKSDVLKPKYLDKVVEMQKDIEKINVINNNEAKLNSPNLSHNISINPNPNTNQNYINQNIKSIQNLDNNPPSITNNFYNYQNIPQNPNQSQINLPIQYTKIYSNGPIRGLEPPFIFLEKKTEIKTKLDSKYKTKEDEILGGNTKQVTEKQNRILKYIRKMNLRVNKNLNKKDII